jgi:hypothetical protein
MEESNTAILLEINKLRENVSNLNEKVKTLETLLITISTSSKKMDSHIDFITNTYETFKLPLYYVKNTVEKLVQVGFSKNNAITDTMECQQIDVSKSE